MSVSVRYPSSLLDEIKARLPISTVVGRRVRLKKAGKEWKGLSPFNSEKTPSFTVNDQKQFYHCFSSGNHGDIFRFLMETEGISFTEAVERLATEVGVELPKNTAGDHENEEKRKNLYDVMEVSAQFFTQKLNETSDSVVQLYLKKRGMSRQSQERFRLGYAPSDRHALRDYLAKKGIPIEMMIETGMLISGTDIPVPFDRFRQRLMIPILDIKGRVVAFGGRSLDANVQPKYLNSPSTPLFNKGSLLYNFNHARKEAFEKGSIIVVEGYMDVIALDHAGYPHTVAPLGTALTEDQLKLLWRTVDEPVLCFDGDKAGQKAAFRALDLALPMLTAGKSLSFALLPDGQDPDDLIRSGGLTALEQIFAHATPLVDFLWRRELESGPTDTPERRAGMEKRLRNTLSNIQDEIVRRYYHDEINLRLNQMRSQNQYQPRKSATNSNHFKQANPFPLKKNLGNINAHLMTHVAESPREIFLIQAFLNHPHLIADFAEELVSLDLQTPICRVLLEKAIEYATSEDHPSEHGLEIFLERANLLKDAEKLKEKVRPGDRRIFDAEADPVRLDNEIRQALILQLRVLALQRELHEAEYACAEDLNETNFKRLQDVKHQLLSLEGIEAESAK